MTKKQIKLIQAWTRQETDDAGDQKSVTYEAGREFKCDPGTAKSLVEAGVAKYWGEAEQAAAAEREEQKAAELASAATKAVQKYFDNLGEDEEAKKKFQASFGGARVVKDAFEDSPTYGYEEGDKATLAGAGAYFADAYTAAESNGQVVSDRLKMAREKRKEAIEKAIKSGVLKDNAFNAQNVTNDTEGGFAVPPAYAEMIVQTNVENDWIRSRATTVSLSTKTLEFPMAIDYDHSNDTIHGGVMAYWKGEEQKLELAKAKMDARKMELNKLTAMGKVTHEFMKFASGVSIGSFLIPIFRQAMAYKEQCAFSVRRRRRQAARHDKWAV